MVSKKTESTKKTSAKSSGKEKASKNDVLSTACYSNKEGIFKLVNGKLFDDSGKPVNSKKVSKEGGLLKLCDEKGTVVAPERGVLSTEVNKKNKKKD